MLYVRDINIHQIMMQLCCVLEWTKYDENKIVFRWMDLFYCV